MKHQKLLAAAAALALLCGCGSAAPDAAETPAPTAQQTAAPAQTDGYTDATFADPDAKVTLILNGAKIDCTVAPGVVFYSVYECDNAWETRESYSAAVDTGAAQKKARKTDGAFYSYVSMNVTGGAEGSGVLNITSTFEGLDTELHLTVNGGSLHILAGLGSEGDGIDSNGYVVINGGTVVALGASMDWAESDGSENAGQAAVNLSFSQRQSADEAIVITDTDGKVVFAYDPDKDEVAGATRAGIPARFCPCPVSPSAANIISTSAATSRARRSPASMTPIASRASRRTPSSSAGPARARSAASAEVPAASAEAAGGSTPAAAMAALTRMAGTPPVRARSCLASAKK